MYVTTQRTHGNRYVCIVLVCIECGLSIYMLYTSDTRLYIHWTVSHQSQGKKRKKYATHVVRSTAQHSQSSQPQAMRVSKRKSGKEEGK